MTLDGTTYFYLTNATGDILGLLDENGNRAVQYTCEGYGKSMYYNTTSLANTLASIDPLVYRGYVYDYGTKLDYLQSRYYNYTTGRFINADAFVSTGQGILGNNMFAYCLNNPVMLVDPTGHCSYLGSINSPKLDCGKMSCVESKNYNPDWEEIAVLNGESNTYKGVYIIRAPINKRGFSYGFILLGNNIKANQEGINTLKHEYGHYLQLQELGFVKYNIFIVQPSVMGATMDYFGWLDCYYYDLPWEFVADVYGGVKRPGGEHIALDLALWYWNFVKNIGLFSSE